MVVMIMKFGDRIALLRKRYNLTQEGLAKRIGITRASLSHYEKNRREPDYDTLQRLANFFEVKIDYILGDYASNDFMKQENIGPPPKGDQYVPVLGTITAGLPIDRIENIEGYITVDVDTIGTHDAFALRVKGNSMSGDRIMDGDIVLCIKQSEVTPNDVAVVAVNGEEATLKKIEQVGDLCFLIASNPDFSPQIQRKKASEVHILGKVVETRFKMI